MTKVTTNAKGISKEMEEEALVTRFRLLLSLLSFLNHPCHVDLLGS